MRRFFALFMALLITAMSLCSCGKPQTAEAAQSAADETEEKTVIRIAGLKGPTSMGMVKMIKDSEAGNTQNDYEFTLAGSADEITPKLIQGDIDIAAVPANLASVLYNNTEGQIRLLAVNTLGVIYIVERGDSIHSVSDLKGKTLYGSGKGSTPEYILRYILRKNGLDPDKDVDIEWKSEHTEVLQMMANDDNSVGLLPQPFVTVAEGQLEDLHIAFDLTEEWDRLGVGSKLITGVLAVRGQFADEHPEQIKQLLEEYAASVDFTNANPAEAAKIIEEFDIIKAAVAEKAIPKCNIVCISGKDMVEPVEGYLQVLMEADPKSVGGKLPEKDFYIQ